MAEGNVSRGGQAAGCAQERGHDRYRQGIQHLGEPAGRVSQGLGSQQGLGPGDLGPIR